MSRIGRKPIVIPAGVTVTVDEAAHTVAVKGPKGSLNSNYHPLMTVKVEGNEVLVTRPNDEPEAHDLQLLLVAVDNTVHHVGDVAAGQAVQAAGLGFVIGAGNQNLIALDLDGHEGMIVGIQAALGALGGEVLAFVW